MSGLSGETVLVTGAGGFIASHLCEALVGEGAKVRGLFRYNSRNDRGMLPFTEPGVEEQVEVIFGDLRDTESVDRASEGVAYVLHLAAQIAIPYSYVNPRDYYETNVLGTLNVCQAVLRHGVRQMVHISTSEVYGSALTVPITEDHPLQAQSPYSGSKIGADKLVESFNRSFELPATTIRPFNTYGPRQSARAVIPTIISQALAGDKLKLGSLHPRRDLTFAADTAAAIAAAAIAPAAVGRTIQLGTGHDVTIGEIVDRVAALMGKELEVELDDTRVRPAASEVERLISSPALAREVLGWEPRIDLDDGLRRTIDWMADRQDLFRSDEYVR
jgi:NAD dependent epimerase/dehydratase